MKKLLLLLLMVSTVAQAETYKWTDKEGTVHYSDTRNNGIGASSAETLPRIDEFGSAAPKVDDLKEQILKDEGVMLLIHEMQNDPEIQALLSDPAIINALQAGDIGTLITNPAFLKLLNKPRVREIEKKMQQGGTR